MLVHQGGRAVGNTVDEVLDGNHGFLIIDIVYLGLVGDLIVDLFLEEVLHLHPHEVDAGKGGDNLMGNGGRRQLAVLKLYIVPDILEQPCKPLHQHHHLSGVVLSRSTHHLQVLPLLHFSTISNLHVIQVVVARGEGDLLLILYDILQRK